MTIQECQFRLLVDNQSALESRLSIIRAAKHSIFLQTFIFKPDDFGKLILKELINAAKKGVQVKILIDDLWSTLTDQTLKLISAHPNIEVKLFNRVPKGVFRPLILMLRFSKYSRRMHNKSLVVDNQLAIIGGRNMASEYFESNTGTVFNDLEVLIEGAIIHEINTAFNHYWKSDLSTPINNSSIKYLKDKKQILKNFLSARKSVEDQIITEESDSNKQADTHQGRAKVIFDYPEKIKSYANQETTLLSQGFIPYFEQAKEEIIIVSPYFLPGKIGLEGLAQKVKEGIKVKVITNSLESNNHLLVHAHYSKYRKQIIQAGIELFEFNANPDLIRPMYSELKLNELRSNSKIKNGSLVMHSKCLLFDRSHFFIGSLNMDPRSWIENTEMGVIIEDSGVGKQMSSWFSHGLIEKTYKVTLDYRRKLIWEDAFGRKHVREPGDGLIKRLKVKLLRLLPVEPLI